MKTAVDTGAEVATVDAGGMTEFDMELAYDP
jgi:hypothetical protein